MTLTHKRNIFFLLFGSFLLLGCEPTDLEKRHVRETVSSYDVEKLNTTLKDQKHPLSRIIYYATLRQYDKRYAVLVLLSARGKNQNSALSCAEDVSRLNALIGPATERDTPGGEALLGVLLSIKYKDHQTSLDKNSNVAEKCYFTFPEGLIELP